jgi:hypothetical protein
LEGLGLWVYTIFDSVVAGVAVVVGGGVGVAVEVVGLELDGVSGGLGLVPEMVGVGEECGVLAVSVDDEGAEAVELAVVGVVWVAVAEGWIIGASVKSTWQSHPGTVIKLNLNSRIVSGSPIRTQ